MNLGELYHVSAPLDGLFQDAIAAALRFAPWCWPEEGTPEFGRATKIAGHPPDPCPGRVPLLAVERDQSSAYLLGLDLAQENSSAPDLVAFDPTALETWDNASRVLPKAVPMLWSSVREQVRSLRPTAQLLHVEALRGAARLPHALGGPSFGLSFLLGLTSHLFGVPVPQDIAASACLRRDGSLAAVGALRTKLELIERAAPRLRRILVAEEQDDVPGNGRLRIERVRNASEALERVFGDRLAEPISRAAGNAEQRAELADSFFRLVLSGGHITPQWRPVRRAAELLLGSWSGGDEDARWKVRFACAVAQRHEENRGDMPPVTRKRLRAFPRGVRARLLANVIQHTLDTGAPSVAEIEKLAHEFLPAKIALAWPQQLRAFGAWARLLAVTGRPREALKLQEELTERFTLELENETVTHQLSERFRLAGALGDRAAWQRALADHDRAESRGYLDPDARDFVRLWRATAELRLGGRQSGIALLRELAEGSARDDLRWSALRHLQAAGDNPELKTLRQKAQGGDRTAQVYAALIDLDAAVAAGHEPLKRSALDRLREAEPGLLGHLERAACAENTDVASYVARFYPY